MPPEPPVARKSQPTRTRVRRRRLGRDEGYVLALTALMMLPILAFTGFAVDLGSWFARAAQIQRAADAAALAGVQDLPVMANATASANAAAAKNGFVNGTNGITITITNVSDTTSKLKVSITDANANQYFTKAFRSSVNIARTGTAQYIKPVSMGSPKNFLGTGSQQMQTNTFQENFWLAISGGCSSKENGDRIQAQTDANYSNSGNPAVQSSSSWSACTGGSTVTNTEYDSNGYFYVVEFKQVSASPVTVEVYDAGMCSAGTNRPGDGTNGAFTTTYQMRDNSSYDPLQTTAIGSPLSAGTNVGCGAWTPLYTINNPTKGTYFVQVKSSTGSGSTNHGSNGFSLRAKVGSTWAACTSDASESVASVPPISASCPQVYGYANLGVLASISGSASQFYLAQLGPEYNNKKMTISLFDPGEGSRALEILDPNGAPVDFDWEVKCFDNSSAPCADGTVAPTGGFTGTSGSVSFPTGGTGPGTTTAAKAIDLWGNEATGTSTNCADVNYSPCSFNPQPGTRRGSTSKYSDRLLQLTVQLPTDIQAAFGGKQWYKIKYYTGQSPSDRTTWSVQVKGAPIRLIPNP